MGLVLALLAGSAGFPVPVGGAKSITEAPSAAFGNMAVSCAWEPELPESTLTAAAQWL